MKRNLARIGAVLALCVCVACTVSEQERAPASAIAAIPPEQPATPEFHGAAVGGDALRGQLPGE